MRRLVNGAFAVVAQAPRMSTVASISTPRVVLLEGEHAEELRRLAHGEDDDTPSGPAFARLRQAGLADDGLGWDDPAIEDRLRTLGAGYAWHAWDCPDREALSALNRRMHARRKMSLFEYGQTAVLPECGVARCWELTRRIGTRKKVLIIGDDDLLAPVLAKMGHAVTVIDIDEVLVDFIARCAREERIKLDARVLDVLAPLPPSMVGAFDVVLTDPMSYERCLVAFLSRATSALRPGGAVFTCVHPLARRVFERVARQLPVDVEDVMYELSVYYYQGFVENWYRSDLYLLRRTAGPDPYPPGDTIPLGDIIEGQLHDRLHSFADVKASPFHKPSVEDVVLAVADFERSMGAEEFASRHSYETDRYAHEYRALANGGHLALSYDKERGIVAWDLYPYTPRWEGALVQAFQAHIRAAGFVDFNSYAPDLAIPPVLPRRKPAPKKKKPVRKKR
ncbi:MAG: bis-aminopropyl spermidine synthase family protein [Deltaproteobacteria bacterium]|nr:bis-aminopropyl spermidine synthase family protein [Deltaproteobacteria bacterium]